MSKIWIPVFCVLHIAQSILGSAGSNVPQSCPNKCDLLQEIQTVKHLINTEIQEIQKLVNTETQAVRQLVNQEIQALRQLLNQESSIRMGIDSQMQDLRKTVIAELTGVRQNKQQINSSLETSSNLQQTFLQEEISNITDQLNELERSVRDTNARIEMTNKNVTAMLSGNLDITNKLASAQQDFKTLNQRIHEKQGNYGEYNSSMLFDVICNIKLQSSFDALKCTKVYLWTNNRPLVPMSLPVLTQNVSGAYDWSSQKLIFLDKKLYAKLNC